MSFDGTKEKGKAISSSTISNEISMFLDLEDDKLNEFRLESFETEGIESFSMNVHPAVADIEAEEEVISTNNINNIPVSNQYNELVEEFDSVEEIEEEVSTGLPGRVHHTN